MTTLQVDGIVYDKEFVTQLRQKMIELRDEALKQGDFEYSVIISHVIAVLYHYIDKL